MKITVQTLRRLIRETVEETMSRQFTPEDFEYFEEHMRSRGSDPSNVHDVADEVEAAKGTGAGATAFATAFNEWMASRSKG